MFLGDFRQSTPEAPSRHVIALWSVSLLSRRACREQVALASLTKEHWSNAPKTSDLRPQRAPAASLTAGLWLAERRKYLMIW
jgi:hypothetical protein